MALPSWLHQGGAPQVAISEIILQHYLGQLCVLGSALLPSFLSSQRKQSATCGSKTTDSTRPLLGLRGIASCIVVLFHSLEPFTESHQYGYGYKDNMGIQQLPVIRLMLEGQAMVSIFFIISGFVLVRRPLELIYQDNWREFSFYLSSATFRRPLRLFIPPIVSTFANLLLILSGLYDHIAIQIKTELERHGGESDQNQVPEFKFKIYSTISAQVTDWLICTWHMINPFETDLYWNPYNTHLWTLPLEFTGSITLFACILGLANMQPLSRVTVLSLVAFVVPNPQIKCMLSGAVLAEIQILYQERSSSTKQTSRERATKLRTIAFRCFIFSGFWFASYPPKNGDRTPGFHFLSCLTPSNFASVDFWRLIGGLIIVWGALHEDTLGRILQSPTATYLGHISFAIYLLHGTILPPIGISIMLGVYRFIGATTPFETSLGWIVSASLTIPLLIWSADLFWRFVEIPSLTLCSKLSEKRRIDTRGPLLGRG